MAMSPRVYEVLVRAALLSGAPEQAAAVLETLLSLLPQPSLRALSGATLRALADAALDKLDVDEAVRFLSAMDDKTLRTPATRAIVLRLASLSAGTRSVAGARCALRVAKVLSGEAGAGLLCSLDDDGWARDAAAAADEEDANTMTEHVVGMLQSGALRAEAGTASTEDGYSVHGMARVLQLLCHVSELTVRLSDVNHLIIQLLEASVPAQVRAASLRDAKRSMVAVQLSQALVQAAALRDAVEPQVLDAALDAEQQQPAEAHEVDPLLAILDDSGRPSARLATRVALSRPGQALAVVRAVAGSLEPDDKRSRALAVAIAAAEAAEATAGDSWAEQQATAFPGAEAIADASGAAVAALSSPRSFVTRGHTLMLGGINDLHRAGLLIGPRAREFVVAFYSRIGLIDSAFAIASSMSPDEGILVPGSAAWLWHGLPLAAAMHLLRACSLRNDSRHGADAFALVKEAAKAEGQDVPPEAFRLLDRLS
ncbi:hypothetical protein FNF29_00101 [Cafeteria roenbergensis]|uniref:Uncharacterized protein n=1 Tax=Cafeteria roenbergensis TaxID=33653 RepID=A0A5A8CX44_CAFRO|nr:hypothetical protein FNF29_00101 [Cafeteria roenbergensis]|eukprot:KAA0157525.1 hypothetical protein FNF29_00101 [Cafeteria roenbergensis]